MPTAESSWAVRQPVHDVDHAVNVPDQAERERDEVLAVARLRPHRPGEGHHSVLYRDDDLPGVADRDLVEDLPDVVDDVVIRA